MKKNLTKSTTNSEVRGISPLGVKLMGIDLSNSITTFRIIGYGLISLWLLDILSILYPLQPLNPLWGFQILGQLVERVGVLLIALGLILIGDRQQRQKWELLLLKILTKVILLAAIAYFFLIPLGIGNTIRLVNLNQQQISVEAQSQVKQLTDYHDQIAASSNISQVQQFINQLGADANPDSQSTLAGLQQQASLAFKSKIQEIKSQSQLTIKQRQTNLIRRSLKWNIGALLSGFILLLLWINSSRTTKITSRVSRVSAKN